LLFFEFVIDKVGRVDVDNPVSSEFEPPVEHESAE
jgi:hypothetical protein